MDDTNLRQLLHRADAAGPVTTPSPAAVAAGVVRKHRRRTTRRRVTAAVAALLTLTAAFAVHRPAQPRPTVVATFAPAPEDPAPAIKRLDAEIRLYTAAAARADAEARLARATAAYHAAGAAISAERERAATTLLAQADDRRARRQPAAADAGYRRLIHLFEDTRAAATARSRLADG